MWSILYTADNVIYTIGPHSSREDAMRAFGKAATGSEAEFDISDQHVYLFGPDHQLQELSSLDLIAA